MTHTTNKQIKNAYAQWLKSNLISLEQCYSNYSGAKAEAWNYCKTLEAQYKGSMLCVIGYNSMTFSAGFAGEVDGREAFIYITKNYDRYIFIDEI